MTLFPCENNDEAKHAHKALKFEKKCNLGSHILLYSTHICYCNFVPFLEHCVV